VAIHDIQVQSTHAGRFNPFDLISKVRKIAKQHRWQNHRCSTGKLGAKRSGRKNT
jgi:hypothetical protein